MKEFCSDWFVVKDGGSVEMVSEIELVVTALTPPLNESDTQKKSEFSSVVKVLSQLFRNNRQPQMYN